MVPEILKIWIFMKILNFLTIVYKFLIILSVETKLICVVGMVYVWPVCNLF